MGKTHRIYVMTEVTRYEEDTWLLGDTDSLKVTWHRFNFDTKYGDLTIDQIQDDIKELEQLKAELGTTQLDEMIAQRKAWVAEQLEYERREAEFAERAKLDRLEAARKILREAGELP